MLTPAQLLLLLACFYPIVTAAAWIAGGLLFRLLMRTCRMGPPQAAGRASRTPSPAFNELAGD